MLLKAISLGIETEEFEQRLPTAKSRLIRDGLITPRKKLTEEALIVLSTITPIDGGKVDWFDIFWKTYPASDAWGTFPKTRVLRVSSKIARKKFNEILLEGYNPEQIINALKADIALKKKSSTPFKNELSFMQLLPTWLNKRMFEGYLEEEIVETPKLTERYGEELE